MASAALFLIVSATPASAQSVDATEDHVLTVTGVEYAFHGLPDSVPAGTRLGLANTGAEVHELQLYRIADEVTATAADLLAMYFEGQDPEAAGMVESVEGWALYAPPGGIAEDSFLLEREGRYAIICLIPQGLADIGLLAGLGPDTDPAQLPPELQALMANTPHAALGMFAEFTVTAQTGGGAPQPVEPAEPAA
jgi:hypothetical protein